MASVLCVPGVAAVDIAVGTAAVQQVNSHAVIYSAAGSVSFCHPHCYWSAHCTAAGQQVNCSVTTAAAGQRAMLLLISAQIVLSSKLFHCHHAWCTGNHCRCGAWCTRNRRLFVTVSSKFKPRSNSSSPCPSLQPVACNPVSVVAQLSSLFAFTPVESNIVPPRCALPLELEVTPFLLSGRSESA
eukprot:2917690-Rhodomonas_salina.1